MQKSEEYKREIEIQRSVKYGIREFIKNREWIINLVINMVMWAITDFNYQINDYYESYFPGDQYQALMAISFVELASYIVAGIIFESF